ncbi:hypothetical protein QAD02_008580 [Eretmocerus hayati]|uniref:Uncharacterized protein n=1 Tax=Eretmocerus hayati TaxID=131215 RepID=A0ACC2N864_9HYME|nr:hypothetical protein QAD02_008580 [Eretmocerus hayati]
MLDKLSISCLIFLLIQVQSNSATLTLGNSLLIRGVKAVKGGVEEVVKDHLKLNCLGIPVTVFANVVERVLTQETNANDVRFYFYSRSQLNGSTVHAGEDFQLKDIDFQIQRNTVFIVHGFWSSGQVDWVQAMKDAFLKMEDMNVVAVDWQKGSNTINYLSASISTRIVGNQIAQLVHKLQEKALDFHQKPKKIGSLHLVGHSLGSHISAHAAHLIKAMKGNNNTIDWTVTRITGLDPAQPCFTSADESLKLDRNDAQFVDVIHTNARQILLLGLGLPDQLGHADFYPDGGQVQLGCSHIDISIWQFLLLPANIIRTAICSHGRSYELFTDSINVKVSGDCQYIGHEWDKTYKNITELVKSDCLNASCPEMGINSILYRTHEKGVFFVPAGDTPPYCNITDEHSKMMRKQLRRDRFVGKSIILNVADKVVG